MDQNEAHSEFLALVKYVNGAADLAEAVEQDIKKGSSISTETVLALSKFMVAAKSFKYVTDTIDKLT